MNQLQAVINHLTWLDWLAICLSSYIILESLGAICRMPSGYAMLCHKVKYVLAFTSSLSFIYYACKQLTPDIQWLIFGMVGTLSFFIWPRTVYRFNAWLDEYLSLDGLDHDEEQY
jgi:hypothetical protein